MAVKSRLGVDAWDQAFTKFKLVPVMLLLRSSTNQCFSS